MGLETVSALPGMGDTIVANSTAKGRGAIAVVRLSGPGAFDIAARHINPWPIKSRQARWCEIIDGESGLLDRAIVTTYSSPNSFTGEDVVEVSTHGGLVVPSSVIAAFMASGARQAGPGEFSRRAVLNGKLDVMQAEAIGDLIDATSRSMQKAALAQLDGKLSSRIDLLRSDLLSLEAMLAYDIDFPEEDDGPISPEKIEKSAKSILESLELLLSTAKTGELFRNGALVVIAGPPNVGKSSLFNALVGHARAIVTEIPGTTRDALEAVIESSGLPLRLVDTAGLHETKDRVERLGIETSERYLTNAEAVIVCGDDRASLARTTSAIRVLSNAVIVPVITKSDLEKNRSAIRPTEESGLNPLYASTVTGEGLEMVVENVIGSLNASHSLASADEPILTRARHAKGVATAREEMGEFLRLWSTKALPAPVAAVHIRSAVHVLEELIGAVDVEDILDRVFSSFCVGK